MSGQRSSDLRSLLEAAKRDAPNAAARAKVWGTVSQTIGAGAATAGAGVAGVGAAKMLLVGTLLGGTLSTGVGAAILYFSPATTSTVRVEEHVAAVHESFTPQLPPPGVRVASLAGPGRDVPGMRPPLPIVPGPVRPLDALRGASGAPAHGAAADEASARGASAEPPHRAQIGGARARDVNRHESGAAANGAAAGHSGPAVDDLAREASLLTSARAALASGDAASALRSIRATAGIRERQLVPEGLALEAQALRALGRADEASAVEDMIRAHYPDSALAR